MALIALRACRLLAGTLILQLCAMPIRAASPEDGRRAYDAGHFADAMGIWADLSRQGSTEAAFGLGLLYDLGNGTAADPQLALFWYRKAAEAGLPAAEFNVGAMYDGGRGVARDTAAAALWYARAAAHGHRRAQFDLGLLYLQGEGVPRNPDAAAAWLRQAANGGLRAAAERLKVLEASSTKRPGGPLTGVTLVSPARNAAVSFAGDAPAVELVWAAPPEAQPVHYEVQVRELSDPALPAVLTASVTGTAALIRFPVHADFYAWSVDTVANDGSRMPSDWNWFSVGSPMASGRSVAAAQGAPPAAH